MEAIARLSANGELAIPEVVCEALGLRGGDDVVFRVEGDRVVLARLANFIELAGSISVPAEKRNAAWDDVVNRARSTPRTDR